MAPTTPLPPAELVEWQTSENVALTADDALSLRNGPGEFSVESQGHGRYRIKPSQWVGVVSLGERDIIVRPKVDVARLFYLLGYSTKLRLDPAITGLAELDDIAEVLVRAFLDQTQTALRRGPLRAYRTVDEALPSVRGRVRLLDQGRRRFFMPLPVEVRYDDFTTDIEENRLLKAALGRVVRMKLKNEDLRNRAHTQRQALENVEAVRFRAGYLPRPMITRLNRHYESALDLARTVLQATTADLASGQLRTPTFLLDMNKVFEEFIYAKLHEHLRPKPPLKWAHEKHVKLDELRRVTMKPDLSLWSRKRCVFVGDAKYKQTEIGDRDDLYQVLAYAKALGVPEAMLIYASVGRGRTSHIVRNDGAVIRIRALDLAAPEQLLEEHLAELAEEVLRMAGLPAGGAHENTGAAA